MQRRQFGHCNSPQCSWSSVLTKLYRLNCRLVKVSWWSYGELWESDMLAENAFYYTAGVRKASGKSLRPNKVRACMYEQSLSLALKDNNWNVLWPNLGIPRPHKSGEISSFVRSWDKRVFQEMKILNPFPKVWDWASESTLNTSIVQIARGFICYDELSPTDTLL